MVVEPRSPKVTKLKSAPSGSATEAPVRRRTPLGTLPATIGRNQAAQPSSARSSVRATTSITPGNAGAVAAAAAAAAAASASSRRSQENAGGAAPLPSLSFVGSRSRGSASATPKSGESADRRIMSPVTFKLEDDAGPSKREVATTNVKSPGGSRPGSVASAAGGGATASSMTPVAPSGTSTGGAGLAARRRFLAQGPNSSRKDIPLQISTARKESASEPTDEVPTGAAEEESSNSQVRRTSRRDVRKIRKLRNFFDEYSLGTEVMPSFHRGMKVLNAVHRHTCTEVVVKVRVKKESFRTWDEEDEWRNTTEFMLQLQSCSNIARVYEVLEDETAYYVIMEKVSGQDLFESIAGQALLPIEEVKEILSQILSGLAELHLSGRIHRDLKLENIMLDRTPTQIGSGKPGRKSDRSVQEAFGSVPTTPVAVKLIDFDTVEEFAPETPRRRRDVLGTDQYIAQEAYDGNYSPASDVFAVGVIAYRLLTGKFPFKADMFDDKPGENWVGSPKMKEIRNRLRNFKIKFSGYSIFETDELASDLLQSMLAINESDRPSAAEALAHPWLVESPTAAAFKQRPTATALAKTPNGSFKEPADSRRRP